MADSVNQPTGLVEGMTFVLKQSNLRCLSAQATVIPNHPVAANHSVTGYEKRPRIHRHDRAAGSARTFATRQLGQFTV